MARTRGASVTFDGDAVLTGKDGEPIPVTGGATWTGISQQANPDAMLPRGVDEPEPVYVPEVWRCNTTTIQRNADARDIFLLLDLILGGLAVEMSGEDKRRLPADLAQHFRRVT